MIQNVLIFTTLSDNNIHNVLLFTSFADHVIQDVLLFVTRSDHVIQNVLLFTTRSDHGIQNVLLFTTFSVDLSFSMRLPSSMALCLCKGLARLVAWGSLPTAGNSMHTLRHTLGSKGFPFRIRSSLRNKESPFRMRSFPSEECIF